MTDVAHVTRQVVPGLRQPLKPAAVDAFVRKRSSLLLRLARETDRRRVAEEALQTKNRVYGDLLDRSEHMQSQLRAMARRILHVQEQERETISRELHDEVAQELAAINLQLAGLRAHSLLNNRGLAHRIARTQRLVAKSVRVVHAFALKLRPALIEEIGLQSALRCLVRSQLLRKSTRLVLSCRGELGGLDAATSALLYRTAQDAMGSIIRRAGQHVITIRIQREGSSVMMDVCDSGRSFDPARLKSARAGRGLGLLCMRERVAMAGGSLQFQEGPEQGTTLRATVPVLAAARRAS